MPNSARSSTPHGTWHELRVHRTRSGYSLTALAQMCEPPMSLSYLSDLERGRQMPSAEAVRKLATALNVPIPVLERRRLVDADGNDTSLREMVRQIVREELAAAGVS